MKNLTEDNTVAILSPSPIYAIVYASRYFALTIITALLGFYISNYIMLISIIFAGLVWYKYLYITSITYTITNETIVVKKGIIGRTFNSIELFRIKDHQISQTVTMRILDLMRLTIYTTDLSDPTLNIDGVTMDLQLVEKLRFLVQNARLKNRIFEIN